MFIPKFEEYLQYICAGIRSHRKRAEIHDELLGHLEDNYERALATGHNALEAENEAIKIWATERSCAENSLSFTNFRRLNICAPPSTA